MGKRSQAPHLRHAKQPMNLKMRLRMQRGQYSPKTNWWNDFWQGISTELFGAVITTFAFGVVLLVFQQFSAIQNRQADLILQMGSPNNDIALEAVRQLDELGWLKDGTLTGANLRDADLTGANLFNANLTGAYLFNTNLTNVNLRGANLSNVQLWDADLTGADIYNTRLPDNTQGWNYNDITRFTNRHHSEVWNICIEGTPIPWYCR